MLDEEMDHIIRDAAENHYPPYNDKAWEKMEKKLDKHLPQKKDRRKFIFFLLLFVLLGGATVFTVTQFSGSKTPAGKNVVANNIEENRSTVPVLQKNESGNNDAVTNSAPENESITTKGTTTPVTSTTGTQDPGKTTSAVTSTPEKRNTRKTTTDVTIPGVTEPGKTVSAVTTTPQKKNSGKTVSVTTTDNEVPVTQENIVSTTKEKPVKNKRSNLNSKGKSKINIVAAVPSEDVVKNDGTKGQSNPQGPVDKAVKKNTDGKFNVTVTAPETGNNENETITTVVSEKPVDVISKNEEKKETVIDVKDVEDKKPKDSAVTAKTTLTPPDKKKPKKNIAGNFGLTFTAGPDLSFIELNKIGKATLTYGAGLSYDFGKRLTVRTGFYVSKKIYTATPSQYNGVTYPNLTGVEADCNVYEIPLSLSYNFWQRKNHNWFGSAGLSSFLMKTEKYNYLYKSSYGQTYNYKRTVSNENKHYFAVLTLSGGYRYQFNKRVSLQAEPYVKLPLSGIGLGKIKLNSSGILLTLTVKPFARGK